MLKDAGKYFANKRIILTTLLFVQKNYKTNPVVYKLWDLFLEWRFSSCELVCMHCKKYKNLCLSSKNRKNQNHCTALVN